jgi:HAE1 family hydrophobic/amphiphilic exporter-1
MAIGWGEGAEIRSPMAVTIIGGLAFSTMLTLIFVPVMYEILDRKRYAGDVTLPAGGEEITFDKHFPDPAPGSASAD